MVEHLRDFDKDDLIRWFFHHMGMELRGKLMNDRPKQYNKVCDQDVMAVLTWEEIQEKKR